MAAKQIDIKDYCDSLYTELFGMKSKLGEYVTMIEQMEESKKTLLNPSIRHMDEIINFLDWKIEIFSKVCPVDMSKFVKDVESAVSVPPVETMKESKLPAGGYLGG
jgi:hypothetical protein